ncbi:hypothetical protein MEME101129_20760 [Methylobacterium mesophilicum]
MLAARPRSSGEMHTCGRPRRGKSPRVVLWSIPAARSPRVPDPRTKAASTHTAASISEYERRFDTPCSTSPLAARPAWASVQIVLSSSHHHLAVAASIECEATSAATLAAVGRMWTLASTLLTGDPRSARSGAQDRGPRGCAARLAGDRGGHRACMTCSRRVAEPLRQRTLPRQWPLAGARGDRVPPPPAGGVPLKMPCRSPSYRKRIRPLLPTSSTSDPCISTRRDAAWSV